jgi:hypothetical protein
MLDVVKYLCEQGGETLLMQADWVSALACQHAYV